MPPPETFHRHQTAILWRKVGDNAQNEPVLAAPIELTPTNGTGVRWEAGRRNMMDPQGNLINVDAVVVVAVDIPIGSQMWLGRLEEFYGTGTGSTGIDDEVMWVIRQINVPDIKHRVARREVWLAKSQNGPGQIAGG
jgi:hypothetical protein